MSFNYFAAGRKKIPKLRRRVKNNGPQPPVAARFGIKARNVIISRLSYRSVLRSGS